MNTAKSYRDIENVTRAVADAAARCAELDEKGKISAKESEKAVKNLLWAIVKLKSL